MFTFLIYLELCNVLFEYWWVLRCILYVLWRIFGVSRCILVDNYKRNLSKICENLLGVVRGMMVFVRGMLAVVRGMLVYTYT